MADMVKKVVTDNYSTIGKCIKKVPSGITIYQDLVDNRIGYRLSNILINSPERNLEELVFLRKLLTCGKKITNIDLPSGVVYYNDKIIGQIIAFYEKNKSLIEMVREKHLNPFTTCLDAYTLIKELFDNGIIYIDIHGGNFLYTPEGIKIIDFEKDAIAFRGEEMSMVAEGTMLECFTNMINRLTYQKARSIIPNLMKIQNLDDLYCELCLGEALTIKHEDNYSYVK